MRLYLSRQYNRQYMLTAIKPRAHRVGNTAHQDFYVRPGDPIGYRNMCQESVEMLLPGFEHIAPLETVEVEITAKVCQ